MGMKKFFSLGATITLLLFWTTMANSTPVKDKVAVLILSWGAPAGACLDYAWQSHQTCRIGDRTLYPGQSCKFGHVGEFPYQIHIGILPWALTCLWPGNQYVYDSSGTYKLVDGLYPKKVDIKLSASKFVTKLNGGSVEVTSNSHEIKGARIDIPADPYPDRPEGCTPETAIPTNNPSDTNDCLWEDTVITIGRQLNPPSMKKAQPVGPAVHFGPYRTMFNRDVTIRLPYNKAGVAPQTLKVYIYNHLTNDWDSIEPESVDGTNRLVTFKTNVLGLFRVGVEK
jgi:hypothetical protein